MHLWERVKILPPPRHHFPFPPHPLPPCHLAPLPSPPLISPVVHLAQSGSVGAGQQQHLLSAGQLAASIVKLENAVVCACMWDVRS